MTTGSDGNPSRSLRVHAGLRSSILRGEFAPAQALRPQELADERGVSLAVVREALLRLVGEGLAVRLHNRGFAVPAMNAQTWQQIAEARALIEPGVLRLAVGRGDLAWEAHVRATHHTLARTPMYADDGTVLTEEWASAHREFHRALLNGCGNPVLMDAFDRHWDASELARRWSVTASPARDIAGEHVFLEQAALERDADAAADALARHLEATASALRAPESPSKERSA